jgi:hypothetical protein
MAEESEKNSETKQIKIEPLDYKANINLEEAEKKYNEIKSVFYAIRDKYTGLEFKMLKEDIETLGTCAGAALLPLMFQKSVQEQYEKSMDKAETLCHKAQFLAMQILGYLSNFQNTGVEKILVPRGMGI